MTQAEIILIENLIAGGFRLIGLAKDVASGNPVTPQMIADEQALTAQLVSAAHAQVEADKAKGL